MSLTGGFPLLGAARCLFLLAFFHVSIASSAVEAPSGKPAGTVLRLIGNVFANNVPLATGCDPLNVHSQLVLKTGDDGQIWFVGPHSEEIRMREKAVLSWETVTHSWKADVGMIGFRFHALQVASGSQTEGVLMPESWQIKFPQGECLAKPGIVVLKVHPILTRIAAVKGNHKVIGLEKHAVVLEEKRERGVASNETSQLYVVTDDLYFAWYWK